MSDGVVKYWKNITDLTEEEMQSGWYNIRGIDIHRIQAYQKYLEAIGEKHDGAFSTDFLNKMEEWYLSLAEKETERVKNESNLGIRL